MYKLEVYLQELTLRRYENFPIIAGILSCLFMNIVVRNARPDLKSWSGPVSDLDNQAWKCPECGPRKVGRLLSSFSFKSPGGSDRCRWRFRQELRSLHKIFLLKLWLVCPKGKKGLIELRGRVESCRQCQLGRRELIWFSVAEVPNPRIIFVGEAPGYHEDQQEIPFVGQAGKLLEKLLARIGLSREDVYITMF